MFSVLKCLAICEITLKTSHYADDLKKLKVLKNIYVLGVKVDMFLAIGLNLFYDVAAGFGKDFHGPDGVLQCNETVYHLLGNLKTGISKDEQVAGGL